MKIEDIADLLAEKINQAHYIKHYLSNVFINGFEKGIKNKENFAIGFAEWCNSNYGFDVGSWVKYENGKFNRYSTKQLLEIYKKTL